MSEENDEQLLDLLSRIAMALEAIAEVQNKNFHPLGKHTGSGIKPKR